MIKINIDSHRSTLSSMKALEKTLDTERLLLEDNVQSYTDVWNGNSFYTFQTLQTGMIKEGLYKRIVDQTKGMRKIMEDFLPSITKEKRRCDTFHYILDGQNVITTGYANNTLFCDEIKMKTVFQYLEYSMKNAATIKQKLENVIAGCSDIVDFGDCSYQLNAAYNKIARLDSLNDQMNTYCNNVLNIDDNLNMEYKKITDKSVLQSLYYEKYGKFLTGEEAWEDFSRLIEIEEIITKDYWTEEEAIKLSTWYKQAVEEQDTKILEAIYQNLLCESRVLDEVDGEKVCNYTACLNQDKLEAIVYYLLNYNDVKPDSEIFMNLIDMANITINQEVDPEAAVNNTIKVTKNSCGLVVQWKVKQRSETLDCLQRMIFDEDMLEEQIKEQGGKDNVIDVLDAKYKLIEDIDGIKEYRSYLKQQRDYLKLLDCESVRNNADFESKCGYVNTARQKKGLIFTKTVVDSKYEYINDIDCTGIRLQIDPDSYEGREIAGFAQDGLHQMTEDERKVYNYLYQTDKSKAEQYITLLTPQLRNRQADMMYDTLKDHKVLQGVVEFGAGLENVVNGITIAVGTDVNRDLDGIPMQTTMSMLDYRIVANADGGWKYVYGASKMLGAATPAIIITAATGGTGTGVTLAATAATYGTSAYGNSYAIAAQQGYTNKQAVNYGIAMGTKEAAKIIALGEIGKATLGVSQAAGFGLGKTAVAYGASTAGIEFVDEVGISPSIAANTLKDPSLYNVDYKQAALNSVVAAIIAGGTLYGKGKYMEYQAASKPIAMEDAITKLDNMDSSMTPEDIRRCVEAVAKENPAKANDYITKAMQEYGKQAGFSDEMIAKYMDALSGDIRYDVKSRVSKEYQTMWNSMSPDEQRMFVDSFMNADYGNIAATKNKIAAFETLMEYSARYEAGYYDSANYSLDQVMEYKINAKSNFHLSTKPKNYSGIVNGEFLPKADEFISDQAVIEYVKVLCPDNYEIQQCTTLQEMANAIAITKPKVQFVTFQDASVTGNNIVKFSGTYGYSDIAHGGAFAVPKSALQTYASKYSSICHFEGEVFVIDDFQAFGQDVLSGVPLNNGSGAYLIETTVPINGKCLRMPSVDNGSAYMPYFVSGGKLLSGQTETTLIPMQTIVGKNTVFPPEGVSNITWDSGIEYNIKLLQ